jgi:hypothetical protein
MNCIAFSWRCWIHRQVIPGFKCFKKVNTLIKVLKAIPKATFNSKLSACMYVGVGMCMYFAIRCISSDLAGQEIHRLPATLLFSLLCKHSLVPSVHCSLYIDCSAQGNRKLIGPVFCLLYLSNVE